MSINPSIKIIGFCLKEQEVALFLVEGGWKIEKKIFDYRVRDFVETIQVFSKAENFTIEDVMFLFNTEVEKLEGQDD